MTNVFSSLKAAWHIERIARLREGRDIVPTHVQIVLSDLCNQDCLVAGTLVDCPEGKRPIEQLRSGDLVVGPDGQPVAIVIAGSRWTDGVYEVVSGDRRIYATGEHPILTGDGWKEVSRLRPGRDSAAVRSDTGGDDDGHENLRIAGIEMEWGLELRPISSVRYIEGRVEVFNFSCPPIEAYVANGMVVHNCHFCSYRMSGGFSTENFADEDGNKNPVRFIPTEKAKEILDDCAELGVGSIEFTGGGEPTVHKDCAEIIGYAQSRGLQTGLVTNAVRLKDEKAFRNLDWLRISLDAGTPETYERIRVSKAWPKVIKSIEMAAKFEKPYFGIGYVVTRENYRELSQACRLVKDLGALYVRIGAMFSTGGSDVYDGLTEEIAHQIARAKELEDDRFKVVDFFDNRVADLDQGRPDYKFCGEQQFVLYIGGDQKVYTCCTNAYTTHGEIGDLRSVRFKGWLAGHRRFDFDARGCHHCQFNDKNRVINFLLDADPKHVNFV